MICLWKSVLIFRYFLYPFNFLIIYLLKNVSSLANLFSRLGSCWLPNHGAEQHVPLSSAFLANWQMNQGTWSESGLISLARLIIGGHFGKQLGSSSMKLNTEFSYDSINSLLGIYSRKLKMYVQMYIHIYVHFIENIHSSIIHNIQKKWKNSNIYQLMNG